jgi:flavin reductase (DIM6/NTAB) family NADH-FMN oxidoreductase RutF
MTIMQYNETPVVDEDTFREAMGAVCTPVAVVTAMDGARPHGTTVSAFCSLSMRPPLVLVALDRGSDLLALVRRDGRFGVNVLEGDQSALARGFARKGTDKFADVAWRQDDGLPRIDGAGLWLSCSVEELLEGGDHVIVTGAVRAAEHDAREPLLYQRRGFGRLATMS